MGPSSPPASTSPLRSNPAAARVVAHVESLIARGRLRPGDRLPPERELALHVGVSRPSVRAGLRWLTAMGVVRARQGSGTFITDGPSPDRARITRDARDLAPVQPRRDVRGPPRARGRHRGPRGGDAPPASRSRPWRTRWAASSRRWRRRSPSCCTTCGSTGRWQWAPETRCSGALVELVSVLVYDRRRLTIEQAQDLKESAEMHRRIYAAIREKDADRARREMEHHLDTARLNQLLEGDEPAPGERSWGGRRRGGRRRPADPASRPRAGGRLQEESSKLKIVDAKVDGDVPGTELRHPEAHHRGRGPRPRRRDRERPGAGGGPYLQEHLVPC